VVELALRLPGGQAAADGLEDGFRAVLWSSWRSVARRDPEAQLAGQVEREVERRVREVSQYIDRPRRRRSPWL